MTDKGVMDATKTQRETEMTEMKTTRRKEQRYEGGDIKHVVEAGRVMVTFFARKYVTFRIHVDGVYLDKVEKGGVNLARKIEIAGEIAVEANGRIPEMVEKRRVYLENEVKQAEKRLAREQEVLADFEKEAPKS
jgi:hypothetical protein